MRSLTSVAVAGIPALDLAFAVALSACALVSTSGSIGVVAMTLPVAWCRRAPVGAAAALALGALLNGILVGSMVRCGTALPAVFVVAFFVAARCDRGRAAVGLVFCAVNVGAQAFSDPELGRQEVALLLPILALFFALGRIVRARTAGIESLRRRTAELRRRREETARMTVMADRARVSEDLDLALRERIARIVADAKAGRSSLGADPARALEALTTIEREGRELLREMREIVGSLDRVAPSEPQPSLAELPALLARTTSAETSLTVDGSPRRLPAGIELAGYRIAEHLVAALDDAPGASIDVRLRFAADAVELYVAGPPAHGVELGVVLAAARERAALHQGTLDGGTAGGICRTAVRLPLGHA